MENREKVLEKIRNLHLDEIQMKKVVGSYSTLTPSERELFNEAISTYERNIYETFRSRLFNNYVYAIRSKDIDGVTMFEYLLTHNGFSDKRPSSFTI